MAQKRCVVLKTATNDGSESNIKSSTELFPSIIERIIGCSVKHKVNIVQFVNKVSVCVLAIWILYCRSNEPYFTEKWDNSSNNVDLGMTQSFGINKNRSLSQVDVLRMTTYDSNYCKPWDKPCSYSEFPEVGVKIAPPGMPRKGPPLNSPPKGFPQVPPNGFHKNGPLKGPPLRGPPNGHPQVPPNGFHKSGPMKGPPLNSPPKGFPQIPPNGFHKNGPVKGPPLRGPPNEHPQAPPKGYPQNGPMKGPPLRGPPNGPQQVPPNGFHKNGPLKGPPLRGPPNGHTQVPPNGFHKNGPVKGPPLNSPPKGFPQIPPKGYPQNGPMKGPPLSGPPNGHPQVPPNGFHKNGPLKGPPLRGPPNGHTQVPPKGYPQNGPMKGPPLSGPPNGRPHVHTSANASSSANGNSKSLSNVNISEVYSEENLPPFPAKKSTRKQPVMFEHNKRFFQETEADKKLEFINPSYQNLNDMKKDRDNKILAKCPPREIGKDVNPANGIKIVECPEDNEIRDEGPQETENEFFKGFTNKIMSNIYEVEMNRDPALELIKENIIDNIISANKGVKKNIDMIKENIANTLKTLENGDWKPPIESIKGTILEKIGSLEPEDLKPKCEGIKDAILEKITENIESNVKPKLDNIKLTVLDTLDDINHEVVQPKINDIKDTINKNIGNLEYEVIPKIGKTIKECVTEKVGDISTGIGKTSETIKDTVLNNVKSIYDNVPVPKNIKEMTNKVTQNPNLTMEQNLINSVSRSTLGFNIFGDLRKRFKKLGNTTKAIASLILSFLLAIGGIVGSVIVSPFAGTPALILALIFSYYTAMKLLGKSFFPKFNLKKKSSSQKKVNEE
ncbi:Plasmodium exported protein, unknown function [Plasmodium knowlesi strain H]|uniref:Uncharacterized protein n=3 Tax=Plasmodium knowlesi TaxID=5850 RepID=A0A5K1V9M7_PLAKH|nr:Plasmodium exported protein, unknown function [Plasmodium knowlesi strain H]OTN66194.1 Uncharacterized protein PKNOH_S09526100 [Plasmodium knowlesi]CAA9986424.1 Plasmodium exported protein, unknown function [Plasmodium knowlesi strain H]SBO27171.1 Plasmodium exported protein, unknown function [Plasmodium knowlesi strain H]SBO29559.1 Plasmodium exported protein, unknown function [Plasmodium knowlesi strain H]VVS75898.1 Plasmodium exported protein, unknown function [Plasmodium knowlesi strain|eukprot:XP_002257829.1 hypothetical protein, conserved in Plasmodium species [Plasmodium knowlesi strain H]